MSPPFAPVCASLAPVSFMIVAHILEPPQIGVRQCRAP
jgi:hypothetical protein